MEILGLTGPKGSGKDTAADLLGQMFWTRKIAFADPLKDSVATMFGWPREILDNPRMKDMEDEYYGITPRLPLQVMGTELPRLLGVEDLWVRLLEDRVLEFEEIDILITVPDVRRPHEAEWLRSRGGKIWYVDRGPDHFYTYEHETEKPLPSEHIDATIYNEDDDFEHMKDQLGSLVDIYFPSLLKGEE